MPPHQQLLSMKLILDNVAEEAARSGYPLLATLAAAAAEAAQDELSRRKHARPDRIKAFA